MKERFISWVFYLSFFLLEGLFISPVKADSRYPVIPNTEIDRQICYMQTPDGRILNLGTLCGHSPIFHTRTCPAVTAANLQIINVNYDGQSISGQVTNRTCKKLKIKVNYQVLDAAGNPIDNGFINAEPAPILPGQSAAFRGRVTQGARVQATHVDWQEVRDED